MTDELQGGKTSSKGSQTRSNATPFNPLLNGKLTRRNSAIEQILIPSVSLISFETCTTTDIKQSTFHVGNGRNLIKYTGSRIELIDPRSSTWFYHVNELSIARFSFPFLFFLFFLILEVRFFAPESNRPPSIFFLLKFLFPISGYLESIIAIIRVNVHLLLDKGVVEFWNFVSSRIRRRIFIWGFLSFKLCSDLYFEEFRSTTSMFIKSFRRDVYLT